MIRQKGITLVESIATLGIMSAVAVGTVVLSNEYTQDTRTAGAAEHMMTIAQATRAYVRDHRATLITQASATTPALITPAMLSAAGYLPSGYSGSNAFHHDICALVTEPSVGTLNTMLVAERIDPNATELDDVSLAHFASLLGAGGGGRFSTSGTSLQGAGAAWTVEESDFNNLANTLTKRCDGVTTGRVQITAGTPVYAQWLDANESADPGFLSRDVVPGNPDANTMQTHIDMGGNRITNLNVINIGSACAAGVADGELASSPSGDVISCVNGTWTKPGTAYWGPLTTAFSALPACNASNMGETRRVSDINGIFVCSGLRWDAALNTSNNFVLPQHLQVAGNASISGSAAIGGNATIGGNAAITGNAQIGGATNLYGSTTTHSTLNANAGINVGSGQTINNPGTMHIEAAGNLYLKPWTGGGQVVVGGGGGNGSLHATGRVTANGSHAITAQSNDWSVIARDAWGGLNSAPTNSAGSIHANDVYLRSKGQWLSQIGGIGTPSLTTYSTGFHNCYGQSDVYSGYHHMCVISQAGYGSGAVEHIYPNSAPNAQGKRTFRFYARVCGSAAMTCYDFN